MRYLKCGLAALLLAAVGCALACAPKASGEDGGAMPDCELAADPLCYETAFEQLCAVHGCGGRSGTLDENGCERPRCESDADCAEGDRCYVIALDEVCWSSGFGCGVKPGEGCECISTDDCNGVTRAHCIPAAEYPPGGDCNVSGRDCTWLAELSEGVYFAESSKIREGASDLLAMLTACQEKIAGARMAEPCNISACELLCDSGYFCEVFPPADCVSFCETTSADAAPGALEAVLTATLQHPEVCWTCDVCTYAGDTGGLCEALFGC